ncbi:replicative DNA helicase, partial [bacterium]|nr:replicative DNA helicase [bacterium]
MPVVKSNKKETDENLIPQNIEAEEAILGAVLVNPSSLAKVSDSLDAGCFYKPAHRYIYEAMIELFNNNDNIDIVSVSDVLSYNGKLDAVGGRAYINDLAENTITTTNVAYYAKIIKEKAIKRALISAGAEIVSKGYDLEPSDASIEQAEKLIYDISSNKTTSDLIPVKDLVLTAYDKIEYRYNHKD